MADDSMNSPKSDLTGSAASDSAAFDSAASEDAITTELTQEDRSLYRSNPLLWWGTLIAPFAVSLAVLGLLYVTVGAGYTQRLLSALLAGLFLFGRFIILGGQDPEVAEVAGGMTSGALFLMVTYMDLFVATLLVFHSAFLFRLPWFGSRAAALVEDGRFFLNSQPWIRRATFSGVVLFVAFPLAAMGSVGGTIFGRLLGMTRITTFVAVFCGSLLGNGLMWRASEWINAVVDKQHPIIRYGGVVLILGLIAGIESAYRRAKRRATT
jgi:uncharacterized membrane protein